MGYIKSIFGGMKNKMVSWIVRDKNSVFSGFGDDVYLSDFVNNCIDRIATEVSKINIASVVMTENRTAVQNDDITRLFRFKPNPLQTTKDFLSCCEWLRRKDGHCFIYPQYHIVFGPDGRRYRKYTAFYPLDPTQVEFGINGGAVWEVRFFFEDGSSYVLPYSEIVHLKWRRGKNTVVGGGDDNGTPDTKDLLRSVQALDKVMQGLPLSIEASTKINGVYVANSLIDGEKLNEMRDSFENHILSSKIGIAAVDLAGTFIPVNHTPVKIEPESMKFLKSVLHERYGISESILSGDYDGEKHSAFYQNCVEDFIVDFEQAMTGCLFSKREQDIGHRVKCYYNKVAYLTTANKIEIAKIATDTGLLKLNQICDMFGIEPFEGGDRRLQSLNFVNVDLIDRYQLGRSGSDGDGKV